MLLSKLSFFILEEIEVERSFSLSSSCLLKEERLDILLRRMEECGLDRKDYEKYINLRRYGTNKHGGYGLGFERFIMYITGIQNIRDVEFFPRTVGSID